MLRKKYKFNDEELFEIHFIYNKIFLNRKAFFGGYLSLNKILIQNKKVEDWYIKNFEFFLDKYSKLSNKKLFEKIKDEFRRKINYLIKDRDTLKFDKNKYNEIQSNEIREIIRDYDEDYKHSINLLLVLIATFFSLTSGLQYFIEDKLIVFLLTLIIMIMISSYFFLLNLKKNFQIERIYNLDEYSSIIRTGKIKKKKN